VAREFSKVVPALWGSPRFAGLPTDDARLAFLYLLTNAHQTSAGAYRLLPGYACVDLGGWTLDRFGAAMDALERAGMIRIDRSTFEVMIERWFKHCPPMNSKHHLGTARLIARLDSPLLRQAAAGSLNEAWEAIQAEQATTKLRGPASNLLQTAHLRTVR
jgi:hypothetical protein